MATAILTKPKNGVVSIKKTNKINWIDPNDNEEVTIQDFRNMILHAENAPSISFQQHTKNVNKWLQMNL
ncbi:MAG: hypothetical protein LBN95_10455 [Prevotellaceae bacterium]|jgi:hypothetical protein|nr:hypothetical protein [Prevotellaceae bacterium]